MNTRKLRWLSHDDCIVNLDNVDGFCADPNGKGVNVFAGGNNAPFLLKGATLDDIHHYLKYGKPKRR